MSMKKISIVSGFILSLLLQGCDWLELLPPDGLVVDEYWQAKEDVEATLMGAYQKFAQMDENLFFYGELRGDMLKPAIWAPQNQIQIMNSNIYSTNAMCNWKDFYQIINYCNNVVELAPGVLDVDNTFTEFQMKNYQAEAVFLRSLAYFYLVRIFGDVPYVDQPTTSDNVDFYIPKASGDSILILVQQDLITHEATVATTHPNINEDRGRATKGAVNALLADIALWRFQYEDVIRYVEKIESLNKYFLMPPSKWFEMFLPGNSLEGIFELQFDGVGQDNSMYDICKTWDLYTSSEQAVEILDPESELSGGERVRGEGTIAIESQNYRIFKYIGAAPDRKSYRSGSEARACNFMIYRFADVQLMKAEALSQLDRFSEAEQILNEIRTRALVENLDIPGSRIGFEDAILEERAKEFAFEGKRYFDLMRMGRRNNYERKNDLIEIIIQQAPSTQKLVLASKLSNPLGWYLPILEDELEKNAKLVQNPYYDTEY